jgi:hypothetical protein
VDPGIATAVSFDVGNIYDIENCHRNQSGPSVAVIRGVLHHLDNPRAAIARLAGEFDSVIALEPNGFNPMMKAIERFSAYHRAHDEKSYWPPALNQWFTDRQYVVIEQKYFCLVPYFCPTPAAKVFESGRTGCRKDSAGARVSLRNESYLLSETS